MKNDNARRRPPTFRERVLALNGEHRECLAAEGKPALAAYIHAPLALITLVCRRCEACWCLEVTPEDTAQMRQKIEHDRECPECRGRTAGVPRSAVVKKPEGQALHATIYAECPHCGKHMEASSIVRAYHRETARRYRQRHPGRTAEACRGWRERQQPTASRGQRDRLP